MKTINKIIIVLIMTTGTVGIYAQQAPMYTHYMFNTLVVNPGYAGSRDALTITALHRSQWVDFKGAPLTQTLTLHTPLFNEHIGVGLSVLNDKIGPVNNTSVLADFAYIMKLNKESKLALGLSAGVNVFQANLNTLLLDQQVDPVFGSNINNKATPDFGFGAYYYRERFYAGVSVPNIVQNSYSIDQNNGSLLMGKEQRHYFFITGALFNFTHNLAFKPTAYIKLTSSAPIEADLTASFILMKKLLLGVMFRTGDAVGGLIGFNITDQLHIGYSYDWSYGLRTFKYNQGSHELVLRYDFIYSSKKQIHSPRNF